MPKRLLTVTRLIAAALLVAARGFVVVGPGEVAMPVLLGAVQPADLGEGPHLANPLASYPRLSVRRQILEMSSGGGADRANAGGEVVSISRDGLALAVDVGFPLALDPTAAPAVYQRIGGQERLLEDLIRPAAHAAVRHGVARFDWEEATAARPTDLAQAIGDAFERSVRADLVRLGFTADEAARAFTFLPVQLRRVLRPQAIQDAVADKLKAQQDLDGSRP